MSAKKLKSISIFFPCYNDRATIASLVIMAFKVAEDVAEDCEVLVVDDGSKDGSAEVLEELKGIFPGFRVIYHEKNMGYGVALRTGFKESKKDFIFYTDGDAQYDVRELTMLVSALREDTGIVNGFKIKRSDPLYRVIIGRVYHRVVCLMFGIRIKDVDCDFRLMRADIFKKIRLKHDSGVICVELIKKIQDAGFNFTQVGVSHYFRAYGRSQFFNLLRLTSVFHNIIKLWFELVVIPFFKRWVNV